MEIPVIMELGAPIPVYAFCVGIIEVFAPPRVYGKLDQPSPRE